MPESKVKIPNTTKPPATPPTIAAMLDLLSNGTKGVVCEWCVLNNDCNEAHTHQICTISTHVMISILPL